MYCLYLAIKLSLVAISHTIQIPVLSHRRERNADISGFLKYFDFLAKRKKEERVFWPKLPHNMTLAQILILSGFFDGGYVGMDFAKKSLCV